MREGDLERKFLSTLETLVLVYNVHLGSKNRGKICKPNEEVFSFKSGANERAERH